MIVDLVRTTTPDGMRLDGVLNVGQPVVGASADLAICLHGVGSNFYSSSVLEHVVAPLNAAGMAVLRVNTRGHDNISTATTSAGRRWQGAAFENVDECRLDVLGWFDWAKKHGYSRVVLLGHSLGALKALYAAANETLDPLRGIIAISPPCLSYARFRKGADADKFFEAMATAEGFFQQRRPDTLFQARFPFPLFMTGSGYVDKYGPREKYNFLKFIEHITVPVLFTFGELELASNHAPFVGIVEALGSQATIQDRMRAHTIGSADHIYSGQHEPLCQLISEWLSRL